jgi:ubiquinone/menaquinone biosynthesis C-methylase UbiE
MFSDPEKNIEQLSLGPGNSVADFGAGSGAYSFAAAEVVGTNGKVYAIDVQKALLEKLKNEAKNVRHLMNLEIVWADIEKLGGTHLRDASMDVVIAANIFFQLEDKNTPCMEMRRILKPGGRALVVDWAGSFGNMGPTQESVLTEPEAKKLFEKQGFEVDREISAGAQHYGIIFRKK